MASAARRGTTALKRFVVWSAVAAVAVLALSVAGAGADSIAPSPTSLSLAAGSSSTVHQTLQLDALPPKADILLAFDTTGSMGAALSDARTDATAIVSQIKAAIPQAQFAVADFQDYPVSPFGLSTDHAWKVWRGFTQNSGTVSCPLIDPVPLSPIECALDSLTLGDGFDAPEAYNTAFF